MISPTPPEIVGHFSAINGPARWALIAAKGSLILAHFTRPGVGVEMDPEIAEA